MWVSGHNPRGKQQGEISLLPQIADRLRPAKTAVEPHELGDQPLGCEGELVYRSLVARLDARRQVELRLFGPQSRARRRYVQTRGRQGRMTRPTWAARTLKALH